MQRLTKNDKRSNLKCNFGVILLLHLIFNTLIVFLLMAFSIELFLFLLRIKNARVRYFCRLLPIFKIPFDALIFFAYGESLFINLNPFSCEVYVSDLLLKFFPIHTEKHLIIPQYIAGQISSFYLTCFTVITLMIALLGISRKISQLLRSIKYLKEVIHSSYPCSREIQNKTLKEACEKRKVTILVSCRISTPFAAFLRHILIPEKLLEDLSSEEFDAIVAHEFQHLYWKDPIINVFCSFLGCLFWWIPTKWWLKRVMAEQETGSDTSVFQFGINHFALLEAIAKTIRRAKSFKEMSIASFLFSPRENDQLKRLQNLSSGKKGSHLTCSITCLGLCILTFFSLWMC